MLSRTIPLRFSRLAVRNFSEGIKPQRTTTDIGNQVKKENVSSDVEGHAPMYAKKVDHNVKIIQQRHKSATDGGIRPTEMQRRFLVLTKLYKKKADIPEYVANGTMNRMHDRMRVVFILVGILGFFTLFAFMEARQAARIEADKAKGVVVTKM